MRGKPTTSENPVFEKAQPLSRFLAACQTLRQGVGPTNRCGGPIYIQDTVEAAQQPEELTAWSVGEKSTNPLFSLQKKTEAVVGRGHVGPETMASFFSRSLHGICVFARIETSARTIVLFGNFLRARWRPRLLDITSKPFKLTCGAGADEPNVSESVQKMIGVLSHS